MATIEKYTLDLNKALGYDFNTVEFAVRDGIPYAIDFCNPAPEVNINSVGAENFEWVVETAANYAIEQALEHKEGEINLTWGGFIQDSVASYTSELVEEALSRSVEPITKEKETVPVDKKTTIAPTAAKAALLDNIGTATIEDKDDLKALKGIGPKLESILNEIGIYTFEQVSKMTDTEYNLVDSLLKAFRGRGKRDKWAEQAQAKLPVVT